MTAPRDPFFPAERSIRASDKPLEVRFLGRMDYQEAWDYQAEVAAARAKGEQDDVVLVVEHPNIYTAGKRTQPEDMPDNGLPVITVDRGGRITWHGEGQLVVYPIIKLAEPVSGDFVPLDPRGAGSIASSHAGSASFARRSCASWAR